MPTQVDPAHNVDALIIGTGEFSFCEGAVTAVDADAKGYLDFGNIIALTPEAETTKEEHLGSYRGIRRVDKTVVTENKIRYKIRCDEWNKNNILTLLGGSLTTGHTQAALTAVAGAPWAFNTTPGVKGKWYNIQTAALLTLLSLTSVDFAQGTPVAAVAEADDDTITKTAHGLLAGSKVNIISGTPPTSLPNGIYYLVTVTTDTFKLASTSGGSAINFTTDGTGVTYQPILAEGTAVEIDLRMGRVRFLADQVLAVTPYITCPAIASGDALSFSGITPMADPVKEGFGRLTLFDQLDTQKVVFFHDRFSCQVTVESASEIDGTGFTDLTLDVLVTGTVGTVFVRDANENAGT